MLLACLGGKIMQTVQLLGVVAGSREHEWYALFDIGKIYRYQAPQRHFHRSRH